MDFTEYISVLDDTIMAFIESKWSIEGDELIVQQDNASMHTSKTTQD